MLVAFHIFRTGSTMNPQTLFHDAASNIISLVLMSTRYDYQDNTLKEYIRLFTENAKIMNGPWAMVRRSITNTRIMYPI